MTKNGNIPAAKDETAGLNQAGSNISALKRDVKTGVERIESLKDDRSAINDDIAAIRSDLQAKGIHKTALDMAMKYLNMDPDKREGFDVAYDIVREAIELPVDHRDLFDDASDGKVTNINDGK